MSCPLVNPSVGGGGGGVEGEEEEEEEEEEEPHTPFSSLCV